MAKSSINDLREAKVIRAFQVGDTYRVTIEHDGFMYPIMFKDGDLSDADLKVKIKAILLKMDKMESPEPPVTNIRNINGLL